MAVAGAVSELPEPARQDGAGVALKTEGRFTRTSSEAATGSSGGNLAAAQGDAWLVRVGFEGSRPFALGDGGSVVPSVEVGLRRDGGDAQSGVGAEFGGGLAVVAGGLAPDLPARGLVAHEASGLREWGGPRPPWVATPTRRRAGSPPRFARPGARRRAAERMRRSAGPPWRDWTRGTAARSKRSRVLYPT